MFGGSEDCPAEVFFAGGAGGGRRKGFENFFGFLLEFGPVCPPEIEVRLVLPVGFLVGVGVEM